MFLVLYAFSFFSGTLHQYKSKHNIRLLCHPFGQENDALSMLKSAASGQSTPSITFERGDGQYTEEIRKEDCVKYLNDNFPENTIVFPPIYQIDESLSCGLTAKMENIFRTKPCFILHKVNFYKHLRSFDFTEDDIKSKISPYLLDEENCIVVYPPYCSTAVVITLQESQHVSFHQLHLKSNANVRAFIQLHQHLFRNQSVFHIIGIVGAVCLSKIDIMNISYCNECLKMKILILSKDDISTEESVKDWWMKMKKEFKEAFQHFSFGPEDCSSDSDSDEFTFDTETKASEVNINCIKGFAGLLVIAEAVTDDKFASLKAGNDEIIKKMILNEAQRKVLLNPKKHKIVRGIVLVVLFNFLTFVFKQNC